MPVILERETRSRQLPPKHWGWRLSAAALLCAMAVLLASVGPASVRAFRNYWQDRALLGAIKLGKDAEARDLLQRGGRMRALTSAIRRFRERPALATRALRVSLSYWYDTCQDSNLALPEDIESVRALLAMGAKADAEMVYLAASQNKGKTVQILVAAGAAVDRRQPGVETPLMWAAYWGDIPTIRVLLDHGADINRQDGTGWTPLIMAVWSDQVETVQFLLSQGADPRLAVSGQGTALKVARQRPSYFPGKTAIVDLLREAEVNSRTTAGRAP